MADWDGFGYPKSFDQHLFRLYPTQNNLVSGLDL